MDNTLKDLAKQYFDFYPNESVIHVSTDNQVFLQANLSAGVNHQRSIDETKKLTTICRKDLEGKSSVPSDTELPTEKTKNADIVAWLNSQGVVDITGKETKEVLLGKVQEVVSAQGEGGSDEN